MTSTAAPASSDRKGRRPALTADRDEPEMASHQAHGRHTPHWLPSLAQPEPTPVREHPVQRFVARSVVAVQQRFARRQDTTADRPRSWRRELRLVAVLYLTYTASRLASPAPHGAAVRNGLRVLDLERSLHLAPEHRLNDVLYAAPRWVSVASAYFYETLHYALTVATLIWLYRTSAPAYRRARNWLVAMTFPAIIAFCLFPVAPPRLTPGAVGHDIIAEQHNYGWWGAGGGSAPRGLSALVNDNAAMPSLHVGWALWVGWNIAHHSRNAVWRAFGCIYPILTTVVVLSTGNHFLLDAVAGVVLAIVAKLVVDQVLPRSFGRSVSDGRPSLPPGPVRK